jgi:hypothetical protein
MRELAFPLYQVRTKPEILSINQKVDGPSPDTESSEALVLEF